MESSNLIYDFDSSPDAGVEEISLSINDSAVSAWWFDTGGLGLGLGLLPLPCGWTCSRMHLHRSVMSVNLSDI